ncbi:unnamed protein product [Schistosoma curassoni]|nr:unnamed protein product [Schistosoma curassoni]
MKQKPVTESEGRSVAKVIGAQAYIECSGNFICSDSSFAAKQKEGVNDSCAYYYWFTPKSPPLIVIGIGLARHFDKSGVFKIYRIAFLCLMNTMQRYTQNMVTLQ